MRFLTELRCEKLRPELFRLTERLDYQAPTATAVATQSPSSRVAPAQVAGRRATEPQNKTHWSVSSRNLQPRRHAKRWAAPSLPPILLALFGEQPRTWTAFRRARASGGPGGGGPSGGGAIGGVASAASAASTGGSDRAVAVALAAAVAAARAAAAAVGLAAVAEDQAEVAVDLAAVGLAAAAGAWRRHGGGPGGGGGGPGGGGGGPAAVGRAAAAVAGLAAVAVDLAAVARGRRAWRRGPLTQLCFAGRASGLKCVPDYFEWASSFFDRVCRLLQGLATIAHYYGR